MMNRVALVTGASSGIGEATARGSRQLVSFGTRRKAKSLRTEFSFLFMKASGEQLRALAELVDSQAIRPVVDRVFPFASTNEAIAYVETGRAKGKVVIQVK